MIRLRLPVLICLCLCAIADACANGVLRNGVSARSMALGGTDTARAAAPLDAMTGNPAGLGLISRPDIQAGIGLAVVDGDFNNAFNRNAGADPGPYPVPDLALAWPIGRITLGAGISPVAAADAGWRYVDAPGGAGGVSYGLQRQHSRFTAIRGAIGAGTELVPGVSVGATVGVVYNQNTLQAPYVFQSQPALRGLKTLLDLHTDGYGWNASAGVVVHPASTLSLGLRYTSETVIHSSGVASGNAGVQLGVPSFPFHYGADIQTHLPAVASVGASWRVRPDLTLHGQVDWIGWGNAFDHLAVNLSGGSNSVLNGVVGASRLTDVIPLNWRNRFVYRAGIEYAWSDSTWLRAGYSYGRSPVPASTLTPLTAAISEQTLSFGIGHDTGSVRFDVAYQWDLPHRVHVATSALRAGEYSNSTIDVGTHWLMLDISFDPLTVASGN